jgi:hypothetical protein
MPHRPLPVRIAIGVLVLLVVAALGGISGAALGVESFARGAIGSLVLAGCLWPMFWWFERRRQRER